ncbi:unnamed protein product, partial [Symbiodinium microadriaticum]
VTNVLGAVLPKIDNGTLSWNNDARYCVTPGVLWGEVPTEQGTCIRLELDILCQARSSVDSMSTVPLNRWGNSLLLGIEVADGTVRRQMAFEYLTKPSWDRRHGLAVILFGLRVLFYVVLIVFVWFAVLWALQSWNYGGPQWRNLPISAAVTTRYICAVSMPLGGLLMVYGPFLNQMSGQILSLRAESWNSEAGSLRVAYRWALAWMLPMLVSSAMACVSTSWIDACHHYFCQDLQLRRFGIEAGGFAAASLFYIHCLVWWRGEHIPVQSQLISSQLHATDDVFLTMLLRLAWNLACWAVPVLLGFGFLCLFQSRQLLENLLFTLGCLVFVLVTGACSRQLSSKQAWIKALAIFISFTCLRLAVWVSRSVEAEGAVIKIDPTTSLAECAKNDSGTCRINVDSGQRKAQEFDVLLLYTTALPASLALAWEALRPSTEAADQLPGPWEWILKILLAMFVPASIASLWGLTYLHEDVDPLAVEILLFVLTGLVGCFFLRQMHWRLHFWTKLHGPSQLRTEFVVAPSGKPSPHPSLRRAAQVSKVAGNRAKVLHMKKPLPGWPGVLDIMPRLDALLMMMQSTILPFYFIFWFAALKEKSHLCSSVPFLRQRDVTSLSRISVAFLTGKAFLLIVIILAPVIFGEQYVHYEPVQDVAGQAMEHVVQGDLEMAHLRKHAMFLGELGYGWWSGTSEMYRHVFILLTAACAALAFCWYWSGMFSILDCLFQSFAVWTITHAQIRKVILMRDAQPGEWCALQASAAPWLQRGILLLFLHAGPALLTAWSSCRAYLHNGASFLWLQMLIVGTLPGPGNMLAVSAANLQDSLEHSACLLDQHSSRVFFSCLATAVTLLSAPEDASLTDIIWFTLQFLLQLKSPLDGYALRLKRIGAIAAELAKAHTAEYEPVIFEAGAASIIPEMRYFGCLPGLSGLSKIEIDSAFTVNEVERYQRSYPSLGAWADVELRFDFREVWVTSRLQRPRLAVSFSFQEEDIWAFWTLQVRGTRACYTEFADEGDLPDPPTFDGQWRLWPKGRYCHVENSVLYESGSCSPQLVLNAESMELLKGGAVRMNGSLWVRAGPAGFLSGQCEDRIILTTMEWFGKTSGTIVLDFQSKTRRIEFAGKWTTDNSEGFGVFRLSAPLLLWRADGGARRVELKKLHFFDSVMPLQPPHLGRTCGAQHVQCKVCLRGGSEYLLSPCVKKITTNWRQVFTGESVGSMENVVTMADPGDEVRRGEGDLLEYEEVDATGAVIPSDRIYFSSEKMQITDAKLTIHASTRSFGEKKWADLCRNPGYASAAQDAGYYDDSVHLMAPSHIFEMMWPRSMPNETSLKDDVTNTEDIDVCNAAGCETPCCLRSEVAECQQNLDDLSMTAMVWPGLPECAATAASRPPPPCPGCEMPASVPWGAEALLGPRPQQNYIRRADSGNAMPPAPWEADIFLAGSSKAEPAEGMGDCSDAAFSGKALHPFFRVVCRFAPQAHWSKMFDLALQLTSTQATKIFTDLIPSVNRTAHQSRPLYQLWRVTRREPEQTLIKDITCGDGINWILHFASTRLQVPVEAGFELKFTSILFHAD